MAATVLNQVKGCFLDLPEVGFFSATGKTRMKTPTHVNFGNVNLFFSMQRLVAFRIKEYELVIRINDFGPITEMHIKKIKSIFSDKPNLVIVQDVALYDFKRLWAEHWAKAMSETISINDLKKQILTDADRWQQTKDQREVRRNIRKIRKKGTHG